RLGVDAADLPARTRDAMAELVGRAPGLDGDVVGGIPAGAEGGGALAVQVGVEAVDRGVTGRLAQCVAADDGNAVVAGILRRAGRRNGNGTDQGKRGRDAFHGGPPIAFL